MGRPSEKNETFGCVIEIFGRMKLEMNGKILGFTAQRINRHAELVAHVAQQFQRLCF